MLKKYKTFLPIGQSRILKKNVDLAFVAVPAHVVKSVLEDCATKGVKIVVISTSAFKEIGREQLQDELTQFCRDHQMPLIGPNLVGMDLHISTLTVDLFLTYLFPDL